MTKSTQQMLVTAMLRTLADVHNGRGTALFHIEYALEQLTGEKWTSGPIRDEETGRIRIGYPYALDRLRERGLIEERRR